MVKFTYSGVSDRDAMILTPFELWKKYRILPLEAALHLVGFLFVLVLVLPGPLLNAPHYLITDS